MPLLLPCLADVGRARTELQKAFELGVLITVGGVDVDVQPGFSLLRLIPATEDDRRLRTAEPFARPNFHRAVVLAIEHDEVQDLAPEPRQHLRLALKVGTPSSVAKARMRSWVGPVNAATDSTTDPLLKVWLSTRPPTRSRASTNTTERCVADEKHGWAPSG